jgi:hypothetical protein
MQRAYRGKDGAYVRLRTELVVTKNLRASLTAAEIGTAEMIDVSKKSICRNRYDRRLLKRWVDRRISGLLFNRRLGRCDAFVLLDLYDLAVGNIGTDVCQETNTKRCEITFPQ